MSCFDLSSGRQSWQQRYEAPYTPSPYSAVHGKGPKSTPAVGNGLVFTLDISGILSAFDARTGDVKWRQTFETEFPKAFPEYGAATSPLLDGDTVVVHVGGDQRGALVAFEQRTGEKRWEQTEDQPSYASPVVATLAGTRQYVVQTQRFVYGIDPSDGEVLWRVPNAGGNGANIVTPLVIDDEIVYGGRGRPTIAIKLVEMAGELKPVEHWRNDDLWMFLNSPVLAKGVVYGFSEKNRGQYVAIEAGTGKTVWRSEGGQGDNAALLVTERALLAATPDGQLLIQPLDATAFKPVHVQLSSSPIWAHPVPAARGLLVRDAATLTLWRF
jgi:outer membrane protein assembly factor BamB